MGRRKLIADSSKLKAHSAGPRVIATGRISRGVSVTYVAFRAMPTADEICDAAIRKVVRELKAPGIERSRIQELRIEGSRIEELRKDHIHKIRAAIALDNFWYYMGCMPAFADLFMAVTDHGNSAVKNGEKPGKEMSLSPRGVSDRVSDTPKSGFRAI